MLGIIGVVLVLVFHVDESNYFKEDNVIAPVAVEERIKGIEARHVERAD